MQTAHVPLQPSTQKIMRSEQDIRSNIPLTQRIFL